MKSIEQIQEHLEKKLSEGRFQHSIGIMKLMKRAARIYGLCPEKAGLAGLLHDLCKEESNVDLLLTLKLFNPDFLKTVSLEFQIGTYLHGPAAACEIPYKFHIYDEEVILAVHQHSGNFPEMPLLARCLHVADPLVPTKIFHGREKLEKLFLSGRLDEAELLLSQWSKELFESQNIPIHPQYGINSEILRKKLGSIPRDFFNRQ